MTLLFSYEELFGATQHDEPIRLTEAEIELLKQKVEKSKSAEEIKDPTSVTISFKTGKKEKPNKMQLTEAQKKLQREAIHSLNQEISASNKEQETKKKASKITELFTDNSDFAKATETPARDKIYGSNHSDYIEIGSANPFSNQVDLTHCFAMVMLVCYSLLKIGLML